MTQKVLCTGGAGFLGRGILRRVIRGDLDWDVTVYSRDETKQDDARGRFRDVRWVIGDVRDRQRLQQAMTGHDLVVHAAALKYIPEAEYNAAEAVSVNVGGAEAVVAAASKARVKRVVGISTDKAVGPVNVYGATKMIMERLFADHLLTAAHEGGRVPRFNCVRYGNVIGSTGSVIPLFQKQFAEDGAVKITDERMTRFWMTIEHAINTILVALSDDVAPGAVIVPKPLAMNISDVARAATKDDVHIEIIGQRPGEKLHELLMHHEESVRAVRHPEYFELLPVGSEMGERDTRTLASHTARLMSIEGMRAAIADAREV